MRGLTWVEPIGSGPVADVHLYEEKVSGRDVAVKVWRHVLPVGGTREAFVAGGRDWAALSAHSHLVKVDDAGVTESGHPYLVMEYAPLGTVDALVQSRPFTPTEVLRTVIPLCGALESAHRAGVVHGRVSGQNVFILASGEAALAERAFPEAGASSGATGASEQGDLYALAALAYRMLAGRAPYEGLADGEARPAVPERILRGDVPDPLQRLLRSALGADPAGRAASAADLGRKLQRVERDVHVHLTPMQLGPAGIEPAAVTAPAAFVPVSTTMPPAGSDAESGASSLVLSPLPPLPPLPPGPRRGVTDVASEMGPGDLEDTTVSVRRVRAVGEALQPGDHDEVRADAPFETIPRIVTAQAPGGRARRVAYVPVPGEVREADRYALRTAPAPLPRAVRPSSSTGPVADTVAAVKRSRRASIESARRAKALLAAAIVGGAALAGTAAWGIWALLTS